MAEVKISERALRTRLDRLCARLARSAHQTEDGHHQNTQVGQESKYSGLCQMAHMTGDPEWAMAAATWRSRKPAPPVTRVRGCDMARCLHTPLFQDDRSALHTFASMKGDDNEVIAFKGRCLTSNVPEELLVNAVL